MFITHNEIIISYSRRVEPQNFVAARNYFREIYNETIEIYKRNNLSSVISFEDCFMIMHYTDYGFERIRDETDEGRQMRNAFYRLAIVQSKDPKKYHRSILYRGQDELNTWYKERYRVNETEKLIRFTSTTSDEAVAIKYAQLRNNATNMTSTVYEMYFPKPFLSANIEKIAENEHNKETVLLPGTQLFVNNRTKRELPKSRIFKRIGSNFYYIFDGVDLTINVTHVDNSSYFEQQKEVMIKLKELKASDTKFYVDC
ncbi:uncharacterized protein LOC127286545 [Leptopilina boulardi]|uniref:uncharacterized protein LOC127286545 n=1 Tax=Leptopilina boulardi TaxID=63433 RepID=UPI0021F51517|nr:uncharacterized protein LOC127286545 [Leptopilina boulardi]XP_051168961.1 uncharacterized protein LOC127286545 [Leptopilina boulardi]